MEDLISIIVPIYNVEKYIHRCVDSIINQTYRNVEIILVDDGSLDKSGAICDEYQKNDERIKVIHKENGGLGFARNSGLDIASGKYVTFVDGDDSISQEHIERMAVSLRQIGADICLSGHTRVCKNAWKEKVNVCAGKIFEGKDIKQQILGRMVGSNPDGSDYIEMSVCMVLFLKKIIDENRIRFHSEREFVSEDLIFQFDYIAHVTKAVVSREVGYFYYENEGSLTTKYDKERFEKQKKMTTEVVERAKKMNIYSVCEQRIMNTFVSITRYCIKLEQKYSQGRYDLFCANVSRILDDRMLGNVWGCFENKCVPIKSRMVNELMKRKKLLSLWNVMKVKNFFEI